MLASRARRRIRASTGIVGADVAGRWRVVEAFLAASRRGDFAALLDLLDPDVTARADALAAPTGHPVTLTGAETVARQALAFGNRAADARVALVDGAPAILVGSHGRPALVLTFEMAGDRIVSIDGQELLDPAHLRTAVAGHVAGEAIGLLVLRGEQKLTLEATLGSQPDKPDVAAPVP